MESVARRLVLVCTEKRTAVGLNVRISEWQQLVCGSLLSALFQAASQRPFFLGHPQWWIRRVLF